jgi:DNA-binding XRE family transcriptional regulator
VRQSDKRLLQQEIGLRIRICRESRGMTQGNLAKRIGVVRTQVVNIEAGKSDLPTTRLVRIARVFLVKTARLLP